MTRDSVRPTVFKFGGTSVGDAVAFERAAAIVRARADARPVVVVSAMSGVTDALFASVEAASSSGLEPHFERHHAVVQALLGEGARATAFLAELAAVRTELAGLLASAAKLGEAPAPLKDAIVSYGERLSSALLAAVLAEFGLAARWVDARHCIVTDDAHGRAAPDIPETERRTCAALVPLLERGEVPVLGGYVGASASGATTTLGRGGSDYTAALVGAALNASEIQIWTDVPGVMTADPRVVSSARTVPNLSYAEASELAYFGAKVLHPKTLEPAIQRGIPVRILDSRAPADAGTIVTAEAERSPGTVKAIAHKTGITVMQITSARMLGAYGFLRALFEVFDRHRVPVDVVTTSEVSVSLSIEGAAELSAVTEELERLGQVRVDPGRAIICIVGEGLRTTPGIAARVFETIRDINVSLISQGASRVNLTFVVDEARARETVARLHSALLGPVDRAPSRGVPGPALRLVAGGEPAPVEFARQLIDIPSVSGDEEPVARGLAAALTRLGYHVELLEEPPHRPGLLAVTHAPPRLVFETHLDTVPPHFPSFEDDGFLYGRGACDAKGILAAQIAAAERLRADGFQEVGLLFVVDEEQGSIGARVANRHPRARECRWLIAGEPTDNKLAVGSKGSLRVTLRAEGTGGHSAAPVGRSAIDVLLAVLTDVQGARWPSDDYFGETTCNIGVIAGGVATNVTAPEAHADLHIRVATAQAPVRELVERAVGGRARIEYLSFTPTVRLTAVPGFEQCVVAFTTDIPHLSNWGTPLLIGPGSIGDAHTARERVAKAELARGVDLYTQLAHSLLARPATAARGGA